MAKATLEERFWSKVRKDGYGGCWLWDSHIQRGYGRFYVDRSSKLAHRVAYELAIGAIPEGLTVDHLCHNADRACPGGPLCRHRRCVNPAHLEAVEAVENAHRSGHAVKTHCPAGHPYDEVNTYQRPQGRICRECTREAGRRYKARKRAARTVG